MIVFRLTREKYKNDLSGKGAEIYGRRWNNKGTAMLYTCESRSLCIAELVVNLPFGIVPKDFYLLTIEAPVTSKIIELNLDSLPSDWKDFPYPHSTKKIGDDFIKKKTALILKVPSAVVPGDFNYLINPSHKDFIKVKIIKKELFEFDRRLFV